MGGYLCIATVATGNMWRLGQLRPGDEVRFRRVSLRDARRLEECGAAYMQSISDLLINSSGTSESGNAKEHHIDAFIPKYDSLVPPSPILATISSNPETKRPKVVYRTAGDRFVLIEYGEEEVDLGVRARVHLFEREVERRKSLGDANVEEARRLRGLVSLAPCVRSTMVCPLFSSSPRFQSIWVWGSGLWRAGGLMVRELVGYYGSECGRSV